MNGFGPFTKAPAWCLLLVVLSALLCCQTVVTVDSGKPCEAPPALNRYFQDTGRDQLLGCLVVFWQNQPTETTVFHPIRVNKQGDFSFVDGDSSFTLPKEARGNKLLYRYYLLTPERSEQIRKNPSQHKGVCSTMSLPNFYCFEPGKKECWMVFQYQLKSDNAEFSSFDLKLPSSATCRVCQKEVCGDKVDNNCNGKVDEYDEVSDKACPTTP